MSKNCYISNSNVLNLHIFYNLTQFGYVNPKDYEMSIYKFRRYIANIRFMFNELENQDFDITYDKELKIYLLIKANSCRH